MLYEVITEQFEGKELAEAHGYVKMNGTVETGLTRKQRNNFV